MVFSRRTDLSVFAPGLYHDNRSDRVKCDNGLEQKVEFQNQLDLRSTLPNVKLIEQKRRRVFRMQVFEQWMGQLQ